MTSAVRTGSGKPLLLVHGLGSSSRNWDPVLPALSAEREVIAIDLPGFGSAPPLTGEVRIATLTDAVEQFISQESLESVDIVGSSMGARMVLEMARRGYPGTVIALAPGGFWTDAQQKVFGATIKASVALVRSIQPALPALTRSPIGRTALLAQFSARPWALQPDLVLRELQGFKSARSLDPALAALAKGPKQEGASRERLRGSVVIGWGRQDKVALPSQARTAARLFPGSQLHWFDKCGHFPHWDQPEQTATLILDSTS